MTDRKLTDEARSKIETYASEHGPELPPIPHSAFEPVALSTDARTSIEDHTNTYGAPART